jgi:hypothetical protein
MVGAALARILVCWTLVDPGGTPLRCELCRTVSGLELRCTHAVSGEAVRTERVQTAAHALELAALWKRASMLPGGLMKPPAASAAEAPSITEPPKTILEQRARLGRRGDLRRTSH